MDKNELWKHIQKCEKLFERRKFKRMILAILLYSAVYLVVFYYQGQLSIESVLQVLGEILACVFLGGITFYFNLLLWNYICRKSQDEEEVLEYLRKRLREKEKEEN